MAAWSSSDICWRSEARCWDRTPGPEAGYPPPIPEYTPAARAFLRRLTILNRTIWNDSGKQFFEPGHLRITSHAGSTGPPAPDPRRHPSLRDVPRRQDPFTQALEDLFPVQPLFYGVRAAAAHKADAASGALIPLAVHLPILHPVDFSISALSPDSIPTSRCDAARRSPRRGPGLSPPGQPHRHPLDGERTGGNFNGFRCSGAGQSPPVPEASDAPERRQRPQRETARLSPGASDGEATPRATASASPRRRLPERSRDSSGCRVAVEVTVPGGANRFSVEQQLMVGLAARIPGVKVILVGEPAARPFTGCSATKLLVISL